MDRLGVLREKTVVFSYGRGGYKTHSRAFTPQDLDVDLGGKHVLVTGANSGIGFVAARRLVGMGADVHMLVRNRDKGRSALDAVRTAGGSGKAHLHLVDLSLKASIASFARTFGSGPVDVLVHNAGMLTDRYQQTAEGIETTLATHVIGPFLLTGLLTDRLSAAGGGRVVFVSSGGMYTQRLDLDKLQGHTRRFRGAVTYAQAKRAQVIVSEMLSARLVPRGVSTYCMHPGWVDTPGVSRSLPLFYRLTNPNLRTPDQGADTMVWLAACTRIAAQSGLFWFDRRPVATHWRNATMEKPADRDRLWDLCCQLSGVDFSG